MRMSSLRTVDTKSPGHGSPGVNYQVAVMRLRSLLRRFQVDKKLLQNYSATTESKYNRKSE